MGNGAWRFFCAERSHRRLPSTCGRLARFWTTRHGNDATTRLVVRLPACRTIGFARGGQSSGIHLGLEVPGLAGLLDFGNDAFQAAYFLYPDNGLVWSIRLFLVAK